MVHYTVSSPILNIRFPWLSLRLLGRVGLLVTDSQLFPVCPNVKHNRSHLF